MSKKWLTVTTTHPDFTDQFVLDPGKADTRDGMVRRLRESGRPFTSGPDWVEYESQHHAMGESWQSKSRLAWSDVEPTQVQS